MKRLIYIVFIFLLVSCSPVRKYADQPEVKGWEKDIEKFETLDKTETYPSNAILFAGSSSIRLWETLAKDMAPYPVIQRGYGGAKLSDLTVYAERIFKPNQCAAIVIFVANDITGTDQDKSPEEVASLFTYLLKTIRKSHPSTPLFYIAVTPTQLRWKVWPEIKKANNLIENVCIKKKNTYFITTESAFLNDKGIPDEKYFRDDKLHLSEEGYKVWNNIIKGELLKIIPETNY